MCELGRILKEAIGNHVFVNKVLRNGRYLFYVSMYFGAKVFETLIYGDNFASINCLVYARLFAIKFLGVDPSL